MEKISHLRGRSQIGHTPTFNVSQKMKMIPKLKRIKIQDVGCRPYIADETEEGYAWVEKEPPLQV